MKSYYTHLKSIMEFGENKFSTRKPILRSSGIFPVIHSSEFSSSIHFLGYWFLRRNTPEIFFLYTLRDSFGHILSRKTEMIDETKSFSISLESLLKELNFNMDSDFLGSIETEFFSTRDMIFPYPALVLEFFNKDFNTCVHTVGRIYNDFEDMNENQKIIVPETGFDIYETNDLHSFVSFVNGPLKNHDGQINYVVTNSKSKKLTGNFHIGILEPFETRMIFLKNFIPNISNFLGQNSGSVSLLHNFEGFFPRFLVGNMQKSFPSVSITHSYYDCTSCSDDSDYWNRLSKKHYDSSVYFPIFSENNEYTDLIIYPNFSPSNFKLKINIHDKNGVIVNNTDINYEIEKNNSQLIKIKLNQIFNSLNISKHELYCAHAITFFQDELIPSRIKFGLNVGIDDQLSKLPCNICFNTNMGNPLIEEKPGSFHWAPIFCNRNYVLTLGNFSTLKNYSKSANVELKMYHKSNSDNIIKHIEITPNSEYRLTVDDELSNFIEHNGWITIKSDNPYIQGFYFNLNSSGSVSGDHVF